MNKFFTILAIMIAVPVIPAMAQAEVDHRGDTIGVRNNGREVVTISPKNHGNNLSLSVGGFVIDFDGGNRSHTPPRHVLAEKDLEEQVREWDTRRYRRRPSRRFTVSELQFGFTNLTKPDYSMYDDETWKFMDLNVGKSISFAFDAMFNFALSYTDDTWFSVGLRPRWNNYVFSERITIEKREGMIHPVELGDMKRYKKSKLSTFSLDIPVVFTAEPTRWLSLSAGLYAGMTLGDRTKVKFKKDKDKGDFGLSFFNAGAFARIKFYGYGVFANYSFTPLFKDGVGPRTNPFTIGIEFW